MAEKETQSNHNKNEYIEYICKNIPYNNIIFIDFGAQGFVKENSSVTNNNTPYTTHTARDEKFDKTNF